MSKFKDDSHEKKMLDSYPQSQNSQKPSPKASPNFHKKSFPPKRILKTQQPPEGQPRKHKPLTRLDGPPAEERKLRRNQWNGGVDAEMGGRNTCLKNRMMFLFGQ